MEYTVSKSVYTIPEVAKKLGIGKNLAYELAHKKDFPKLIIGHRKIVVPIKAFERWLESKNVM